LTFPTKLSNIDPPSGKGEGLSSIFKEMVAFDYRKCKLKECAACAEAPAIENKPKMLHTPFTTCLPPRKAKLRQAGSRLTIHEGQSHK
jgi:hypothetical protein